MKVTIRKIGNFYHVFDEDVYILYYLFHYKIYQGKCGFPKSAYNKVIQKLEECRISMVVEKFKVIDYQIYSNNQYEKNMRLIVLKQYFDLLFQR